MSRSLRAPAAIALVIALSTVSSGCWDAHQVDALHAAQADSSAAGYDVGVRQPRGTEPAARRVAMLAGTNETATAPDSGMSSPEDSGRTATDPETPTRASPHQNADTTKRDSSAPATVAQGTDSAHDARGEDVATLPAELLAVPDDSIVVNTFLAYNPQARVVWIDLIAGFDGGNGALNFNGGFEGRHTLVVPLGWRVAIRFANRDRDLSHSAIVVRHVDAVPLMIPPAAFPNAYTISLERGLMEGRTDEVHFSADTQGRYQLVCAVPGHGQGGMWVGMEISASATLPEYRRR